MLNLGQKQTVYNAASNLNTLKSFCSDKTVLNEVLLIEKQNFLERFIPPAGIDSNVVWELLILTNDHHTCWSYCATVMKCQ